MNVAKLSDNEIESRLPQIPAWAHLQGKLHREFQFVNFTDAFSFMTRAAFLSEKKNHHPEWLNVYNRVTIDLVTHEADGITERDFAWAKAADELYRAFPEPSGKVTCCG